MNFHYLRFAESIYFGIGLPKARSLTIVSYKETIVGKVTCKFVRLNTSFSFAINTVCSA